MLKKYPNDVNLVIKHYPLKNHKFAKKASLAALAAAKQGKYAAVTKIFLQNYRKLNDETIKTFVQGTGLDMVVYEKDIKSPALNSILNQDVKTIRQVGVRGVPAVYINGKKAKSRSIDFFSKMIEKELKKGK